LTKESNPGLPTTRWTLRHAPVMRWCIMNVAI